MNNVSIVDYLKRPEFVTLIVAGLVHAAVALGLPEKAGLPIPVEALNSLVLVGWSVFLGALHEGGIKQIDYVGTLKGIFIDSKKMRALYVSFGVAVLGGAIKALGAEVDDNTLGLIVAFFIPIILGKAHIDASTASQVKAGIKIVAR